MVEEDNIFYNYVYLDPRKPGDYNYGYLHFDFEPFYVGKGKNDRYLEHLNESRYNNKFKSNKIKKIKKDGLKPIILKIYDNLDEKTAFENEIHLIKIIGRHDLVLGPLTNLTDGGEGGDISSKKIYQYNLNKELVKEYKSQKEAMNFTKIKGINSCLKNKTHTSGNFIWSFDILSDNDLNIILEKIKKRKTSPKKIYKYDLNFNLIEEYESITIAEKNTGVNHTLISNCLNNRIKTAGGFIWKFENNINDNIILDERITKIYKYDLDFNLIEEYESSKKASCDNNINNIHKSIKDKKILGGFIWSYNILEYDVFLDILDTIQNDNNKIKNKPKSVKQYDLNNNFIKKYSTICDAGKKTNINRGNISYCCQGKQNTAGGFIWRYDI